MTVREVIDALEAVAQAFGDDLQVLHHDDWNEFVVDIVRYEPAFTELDWRAPAHVVIDNGDFARMLDGKGGFE